MPLNIFLKEKKLKYLVILIFDHRKVLNLAYVKLKKTKQNTKPPQYYNVKFFSNILRVRKKATSKISSESTSESHSKSSKSSQFKTSCMFDMHQKTLMEA